MPAYLSRPHYQRNDYISWITRAKLPQTQKRRLAQMLDELGRGGIYMKMKWNPRRSKKRSPLRHTGGSARKLGAG